MVLSLLLLISNVMTFPFKNTDAARAATGALLWEEHNVRVVRVLLSASVHIHGDGFMHGFFYREEAVREEVNPVPGLKANTACHIRGLESADDKRGSPPCQTSVQGDSWGLRQIGGLGLAGVGRRE